MYYQEAIQLCDRNTRREVSDGEQLWFSLLDEGVRHQRAMKAKKAGPTPKVAGQPAQPTPTASQDGLGDGRLMQRCLYTFTHKILEAMKHKVQLHVILARIMKDHGTAEFKEFKTTILGMLDTYGYEQRILKTANDLLQADMFQYVWYYRRVYGSCSHEGVSDVCLNTIMVLQVRLHQIVKNVIDVDNHYRAHLQVSSVPRVRNYQYVCLDVVMGTIIRA